MMLDIKERLIVALDVATSDEALALVDQLTGVVGYFKIGMQLYYACGNRLIKEITDRGGKIFLDLKLHDIPNTVHQAAKVIAGLGVSMTNFHVAGGSEMLTRAVAGLNTSPTPTLALGVTVLTSLDNSNLTELGIKVPVAKTVASWSSIAQNSGCQGVVCSPQEIKIVKEQCGAGFLTVTPGIRPSWSTKDDQKRITTPYDAIKQGGDYIVIGRPIRTAAQPRQAAMRIVEEMLEGYIAFEKQKKEI